MFKKGKVLAIIPARSGSKGIKNKNIIDLYGKPLLSWTIEAALNCTFVDDIVISSDNKDYISIAEKAGANLIIERPEILSSDHASSIDVVLHALEIYSEYQWFVLLQPTSPLRTSVHITESFNILKHSKSKNVVSVCKSTAKPNHMFEFKGKSNKLSPVLGWEALSHPRQRLKTFYELNGAIYAGEIGFFRENKCFIDSNTSAYVMDKAVSLDIDDAKDLDVAKLYMEAKDI